jgi:hypothetical protein
MFSIYAASPQRTARDIAWASSMKRASISSSASRLFRKMPRHIIGSETAAEAAAIASGGSVC